MHKAWNALTISANQVGFKVSGWSLSDVGLGLKLPISKPPADAITCFGLFEV